MSYSYKIGATPKEYRITLSDDELRVPEDIYYPAEERRNRRKTLMDSLIEERRVENQKKLTKQG